MKMGCRVDAEVEQLSRFLGVRNPVGELSLKRHRLEIASHLVEYQIRVHAAGRNNHNPGVVFEVEER
jgi:hypothetical protein